MILPPLRWGLLACGGIAHTFAKAVLESESGILSAVASRQQETADAFAAQHGGPRAHGSYEALLADPDVEAVYISTPHPQHAEWAIAAARAGKHILCEKPLAMDAAEAEAVAAAAAEAGVFLMEAFMYRCHPLAAQLVELVSTGAVGDVGWIEANFSFRTPFNAASRLFNRELGGGGILDVGCYPASMVRLLAGAAVGQPFADPTQVFGTARFSEVTGVDVVAAANLKFDSGILAIIGCGLSLSQESRVRVYGSRGWLQAASPWFGANKGEAAMIRMAVDGAPETTVEAIADRSLYALEAEAVAEAIRNGQRESSFMPVADSLGNMRTLDRWRQSAMG